MIEQPKQEQRSLARGIAEACYDAPREPRFVTQAHALTKEGGYPNWLVGRLTGSGYTQIAEFTGPDAKHYAKAFVALAEAMADEDEDKQP